MHSVYKQGARKFAFNLGPVHTYPDSFVSASILLRIQKFTRPHVCGFVAFSSVHTYPRKRYEYARFAYRACAITCDEPAMLLVIAECVYFVLTYIEKLDLFENSPSIAQRQQSG